MNIHMYKDMPNFGDVLNRYLWPQYLQPYLERDDDILMFGIGTLLGSTVAHQGRVIVFGTGCGYEKKTSQVHNDNWKIFFVRGPLTAKLLGLNDDMAITDPAILAPDVFPASPSHGETLFIPHWETSFNPLWPLACKAAGITYVDPLAPVADVIAKISGARLVISEAMHGAILADAYRVPWIPVSTSARVNHFKWTDWANSLGVQAELHSLSPIGFSDSFRALTADRGTAQVLEQEAKRDGLSLMPQTGRPVGKLLDGMNKLFSKTVPGRYKPRVTWLLLSKLGPRFDRYIADRIGKGHFSKQIRHAADELSALAKQTGWLSTDQINDAQKMRIRQKIEDVKTYLMQAA